MSSALSLVGKFVKNGDLLDQWLQQNDVNHHFADNCLVGNTLLEVAVGLYDMNSMLTRVKLFSKYEKLITKLLENGAEPNARVVSTAISLFDYSYYHYAGGVVNPIGGKRVVESDVVMKLLKLLIKYGASITDLGVGVLLNNACSHRMLRLVLETGVTPDGLTNVICDVYRGAGDRKLMLETYFDAHSGSEIHILGSYLKTVEDTFFLMLIAEN